MIEQPFTQPKVTPGGVVPATTNSFDAIRGRLETQLSLAEDFQRRNQERFGRVSEFAGGEAVRSVEAIRDLSQRVPGEAPSSLIGAATGLGQALQTSVFEAGERASADKVDNILNSLFALEKERKDSKRADALLEIQEKQEKREDFEFKKELFESGLKFDEETGELIIDPDVIPKQTEDEIDNIDDLRKELMGQQGIKDFLTVKTSFEKIQGAGNTAADDLAMIFSFMKVLDPGSTVREGEFANAQNSAGVPERIRNLANKVAEGTRLTPKQRAEFKKTSVQQYNAHIKSAAERAKFYRELAETRGLSADDVVGVLGDLEPILMDAIASEEDEDKKNKRKGFFGKILDALFGTQKTIKVKEKSTGKSGSIPENEFDESLYERIE